MKSYLPCFIGLTIATLASPAQADIVKCTSTLAGQARDLVVFIQRDGSTGALNSRPSDDVILTRKGAAGAQATLGHFQTDGGLNEVGYDVDEGIRLFVSRAVERDQDKASRIVMGRELKAIDDLHIWWGQYSGFQTAKQFSTQIRADVRDDVKEYSGSLEKADAAPVSVGSRNDEPTAYSLQCSQVGRGQFTASDKLDAQGNFVNLEDLHDWAISHTN